jgi:hypothetical protein
MAPELATTMEEIGEPELDVFAVGVVLWELLVQRTLFPSRPLLTNSIVASAEWIAEESRVDLDAGAVPLPSKASRRRVDPALDMILLKALARAPQDRFRNADDFRTALTGVSATRAAPRSMAEFVNSVVGPNLLLSPGDRFTLVATAARVAADVAGSRGEISSTAAKVGTNSRSTMVGRASTASPGQERGSSEAGSRHQVAEAPSSPAGPGGLTARTQVRSNPGRSSATAEPLSKPGPAPSSSRGSAPVRVRSSRAVGGMLFIAVLIAVVVGVGWTWHARRSPTSFAASGVEVHAALPSATPSGGATPATAPAPFSQSLKEKTTAPVEPALFARTAKEKTTASVEPAHASARERTARPARAKAERRPAGPSVDELIARANEAFERGQFQEATELGRSAVRKGGGEEAYTVLGVSSLRAKDYATARSAFQAVLKLNPSSRMAQTGLDMIDRQSAAR